MPLQFIWSGPLIDVAHKFLGAKTSVALVGSPPYGAIHFCRLELDYRALGLLALSLWPSPASILMIEQQDGQLDKETCDESSTRNEKSMFIRSC